MSDRSEQLDQIATALSAFQAEVGSIPKTADNPFFKSKFADLPAVVKVASPILAKHGLAVSQFPGVDATGDTLTTWLLHKSGQFLSESMRLYSSPGKGQSAAQGQGSATTFARRYAYMAALGLVADEDNDGNGPEPPSSQASDGDAVVSEGQRRLIWAKAKEAGLGASQLVSVLRLSAGKEPILFETEAEAGEWLDQNLPRFPKRLVNTVVENVAREAVPVPS